MSAPSTTIAYRLKVIVRRWISKAMGFAPQIVLALTAVVLTGCTKPYSNPHISVAPHILSAPDISVAWPPNGSAHFEGLLSQAKPDEKVIWTHGVCPTGLKWVDNRSTLIQAALGPGATVKDNGRRTYSVDGISNRLLVYNRVFRLTDSTGEHNISTYFIVWSNMTDDNRNALTYDWSNSYIHASLNDSMKQFFDQCLVDAVAYVGVKGVKIRQAIQTALQDILADPFGGKAEDALAIVTESLGSKIPF